MTRYGDKSQNYQKTLRKRVLASVRNPYLCYLRSQVSEIKEES